MGLAAPDFPPQTFAIILWKYSVFPVVYYWQCYKMYYSKDHMYVPVVKGCKGFYSMKKKDQLKNRNYIEDVKMYRLFILLCIHRKGSKSGSIYHTEQRM